MKLVIRPADTEVQLEADPREEYLEAEDFSEGFKVKLPKGFTLDSTSESVLEKQRKAALQRIEDIKDKQRACSNCRKITSELSLENATAIVNKVFDYAKGARGPISVVVGQRPSGEVTIDCTAKPRIQAFIVGKNNLEIAHYEHDSLLEQWEVNIEGALDELPADAVEFVWLTEHMHEK